MASEGISKCANTAAWGPAAAGFDEGDAAYQRGDYAAAVREWRPLAEQGNARAQAALGFLYESGMGVSKSDSEAAKWYHTRPIRVCTVRDLRLALAPTDRLVGLS